MNTYNHTLRGAGLRAVLAATIFATPALAQAQQPPAPPAGAAEQPGPPPAGAAEEPATPPPTGTDPELAPPDPTPAPPPPAAVTPPPVNPVEGKWQISLYGFVQLDYVYDSTQSYAEFASNLQVARPNTYAGENSRMTFSGRDSRLGVKVVAPPFGDVKTSGVLETDFYGFSGGNSEAGSWTNAPLRVRHANFTIEMPELTLLFGQSWQLLGWQPIYFPSSWEVHGLPGQLFSRAVQIRATKKIKMDGVTLEIAGAAARPPQRNGGVPDGQAGIRLALDDRMGTAMLYSTGKLMIPLSVAVTGNVRHFRVPELETGSTDYESVTGGGFAIDAFIPILAATKENQGNSLSLSGEFAYTQAGKDFYTALGGGYSLPQERPDMTPYNAGIDAGHVAFDVAGDLRPVDWMSYWVSLQYFFPGAAGNSWTSIGYSRLEAPNGEDFAATDAQRARLRKSLDWVGISYGIDPLPPLRFVVGYSYFRDTYLDGVEAPNHRVGLSSFFLF